MPGLASPGARRASAPWCRRQTADIRVGCEPAGDCGQLRCSGSVAAIGGQGCDCRDKRLAVQSDHAHLPVQVAAVTPGDTPGPQPPLSLCKVPIVPRPHRCPGMTCPIRLSTLRPDDVQAIPAVNRAWSVSFHEVCPNGVNSDRSFCACICVVVTGGAQFVVRRRSCLGALPERRPEPQSRVVVGRGDRGSQIGLDVSPPDRCRRSPLRSGSSLSTRRSPCSEHRDAGRYAPSRRP